MPPEPPPAFFDALAGIDPELLFQHPAHRLLVDITVDPLRLADPLPEHWSPGFPVFAKLGAKSWRDAGLQVIAPEQPFAATIARMLARPSPRLARYVDLARGWRPTLDLQLFRYRDFTDISELRWDWRDGRAHPTSRCLRGRSAACIPADATLRSMVEAVAAPIAARLIVDLAVEPDGRVSVLEVNPVASATPVLYQQHG